MRFRVSFFRWALWAGCVLTGASGCAHFELRPLEPKATAEEFEARSLSDPALGEFVLPGRTNRNWPPKSWDFETLTRAAFYFHPSLEVARAEWRASQAETQAAGARPNPTISLTPGASLNPAAGVSPWTPGIDFDIPIETGGKRAARVTQAQRLSDAARLNVASAAWEVRSKLRNALLDFAASSRRVALLQSQLQLQQQQISQLEGQLAAGAISRNEIIALRIAAIRAASDLASEQQHGVEARLEIAEALGLPAKAIGEIDLSAAIPFSSSAGAELTTAAAKNQALTGRSDILAALAEYEASQAALQLELAKQYPDLHLGPGYQFDQGEHKWTLAVTLELPVFDRNQGGIAKAEANRRQSAARFVALQASILAQLEKALAARATALQNAERQQQLTRLARDQVIAVEAMARAGAADRVEVLSAQIEAEAQATAALEIDLALQRALADLEDAVQSPIESWPALAAGRSER